MRTRIATVAVFAALAVGAFALVQDAVNITWKPKVGDLHKFSLNFSAKNVNVGGQTGDVEVKGTVTDKVKEIKSDGNIVIETTQSDTTGTFGGNDITAMLQQMDDTATETQSPTGEVLERKSKNASAPEDDSAGRMLAIGQFIFPKDALKQGDSWTYSKKGDGKKTYDVECKYTYNGTETIGKWPCYKIAIECKEKNAPTNITGKGTVWVAVDGQGMVKLDQELKNVPQQGLLLDPHIILERKE